MNRFTLSHQVSKFCFGFVICFTVLLAGCGGGGGSSTTATGSLSAITVTPTTASIAIGANVSLTAMGTYSDNTTANLTTQVSWMSASSSIASVDSSTGVVRAVSAGTTTITAALNGKTSQISINVTASGWAPTKHLAYARYDHTSSSLLNGMVLVAGGYGAGGALNSAELYDPGADVWTNTYPLAIARGDHTSTQLGNGQILVVGGANSINNNIASSEVYVQNSGWIPADNLLEGRSYHTATLLSDGTVLVVGGGGAASPNLASSERYNPNLNNGTNKGAWSTAGSLKTGRNSHTATLLANNKVLVAGGIGGVVLPGQGVAANPGSALASTELYDPNLNNGTWITSGSLNIGRYSHTATLLANGKILVVGGYESKDSTVGSAELYDPASGSWTITGSLNTPRALHTATLLTSGINAGKVLVMGGEVSRGIETKSTELYDPHTGTWTATGDLMAARDLFTATLLSNGKVLAAGGTDESASPAVLDKTELYW